MGAITTTAVNACDAGVWLDNAAGTLIDIGGSTNKVDLEFKHELGAHRAFGTKWQKRLECGKDASFTVAAIYSTTATEASSCIETWYHAVSPGARTLKVYIPKKNVGAHVYSMEVRIESYKFTADVNDPAAIMMTSVFLPDGEVTYGTAAT